MLQRIWLRLWSYVEYQIPGGPVGGRAPESFDDVILKRGVQHRL